MFGVSGVYPRGSVIKRCRSIKEKKMNVCYFIQACVKTRVRLLTEQFRSHQTIYSWGNTHIQQD